MSIDNLTHIKETDTTRTVKGRINGIIGEMEKRGIEDARFQMHQLSTEYALAMKEKYPELCKSVEAYHALIGSGIPSNAETIADFPDEEDSVKTFLDELEQKLLADAE